MKKVLCLVAAALLAACSKPAPVEQAKPAIVETTAPRIFVTNEVSGDMTVIDSGNYNVIATIPLGKRPRGIHASPDRKTIYVALSGSPIAGPGVDESTLPPPDKSADGIGVFDVAQMKIVRTLKAGSDPENFAVSADGSQIYISNEDGGVVSVVDIAAGNVVKSAKVGEQPEGVTLTPDHKLVYVTSEENGTVAVYDPATDKVLRLIKVGHRPRSVAFTPDGKRAYVNAENDGTVGVIDTAKGKMISTIPLGKPGAVKPMAVLMSPDGGKLYVSTGRGKDVVIIDTATNKVVNSIEVGQRPWGIALSPDGKTLYTANGPSNDISVVDLATNTVTKKVPTGKSPWGWWSLKGKVSAAALACAALLSAQPTSWHIDPLHSLAEFSVKHMMISTVRGQFGGVKGTIVYDAKNPGKSTVEATIDCTTVNTGEPKRDADLRSAEFFDIQHYPVMKFKSNKVEVAGPGELRVTGTLTINAVTRTVVLKVDGPTGPIKDTQGREKLGLNATTKVSRKDYGILYNPIMETGGVAVSDEVQINLDIELIRN